MLFVTGLRMFYANNAVSIVSCAGSEILTTMMLEAPTS